MSKSLARVRAALKVTGIHVDLREMAAETRTAIQAAEAVGCAVDQITKSLLFRGETSGNLYLFLTAGGSRVSIAQASALTGEPLDRAEATEIRRITGFAIGGVAPVGHLTPVPVFIDSGLMAYPSVWAAAGTPRHVFRISPQDLAEISHARLAEFCE